MFCYGIKVNIKHPFFSENQFSKCFKMRYIVIPMQSIIILNDLWKQGNEIVITNSETEKIIVLIMTLETMCWQNYSDIFLTLCPLLQITDPVFQLVLSHCQLCLHGLRVSQLVFQSFCGLQMTIRDNKNNQLTFKSKASTTANNENVIQKWCYYFKYLWDSDVARLRTFCLLRRMAMSVSMSVRPATEKICCYHYSTYFLHQSLYYFVISPFDICVVVTAIRERRALTCSTSSPSVNPAPSWYAPLHFTCLKYIQKQGML